MNILIISFFDDNFGDMLIRICFERLLDTALDNLSVPESDRRITAMPIKKIDEEKVRAADLIFFAGGAMFGFNGINSFESMDAVTAIAEEEDIPVVLSSMGLNNPDADEESAAKLGALLTRRCIKAMSVRESADSFSAFTKDCPYPVQQVCDPAVWAKYVYADEISGKKAEKSDNKIIGVNVVRGGLFQANGHEWTLRDEEAYIRALTQKLDEKGANYLLFTNGSFLDNSSLGYIAERCEIPPEKTIYPDSTRELIRTVARCDAVTAIRMHASIISYALDTPSLNLVWNEKIPHFYRAIGNPDRAVALKDAIPEKIAEKAIALTADSGYKADEDYLMSLYGFLFGTLSSLLQKDAAPYDFTKVARLIGEKSAADEDITDYRTKLARGRYCYQVLFNTNLKRKEKIETQKENIKKQKKTIEKLEKDLAYTKKQEAKFKKQYEDAATEATRLREQLDRIYSRLPVRIYHKLTGKKPKR